MSRFIWIGIFLLFSCNVEKKENNYKTEIFDENFSEEGKKLVSEPQQYCWKGNLNSRFNILLHYQIHDNLIVGNILYLDNQTNKPIRIIGTIEEDKNFRLLEFDRTGNITGIIKGLPSEKEFNGSWFSPKTRKELSMSLKKVDTVVKIDNLEINLENIIGEYYYQYSEAGSQGNLTIKKVDQNKISFSILSVTGDPGRNIADIQTDTVTATKDFIYKVPETDSCEFRIRFFNEFAYINYTRGYCNGIFGHNATVDGIFYKQR